MRPTLFVTLLFATLAGCNMDASDDSSRNAQATSGTAAGTAPQDAMAAHDPASGATLDPSQADDVPRPVMQMQVVLDRLGFTPGVVDGKVGLSTRNAISGFQEAKGLPVTGEFDDATRQELQQWSNIPATRVVTIPADFAAGPFQPIPKSPADQAKMDRLGYQSLDEKLAERFHTTPETLLELNSGNRQPQGSSSAPPSPLPTSSPTPPTTVSHFSAGQRIRVPNIGGDAIAQGSVSDAVWRETLATLGVGSEQPQADKIVVSKSKGTLRAYDASGKLIGMYTATMGSSHDPLPLGQWKVTGVSHNPHFSYNPELFWDVPDSAAKQQLPPGPNGPVGVVWIDLSKPHYGIHGTPEPTTIGRVQSHGCVRLTNWDAARLAQMVKPGTQVLFEA